MIPPERVSNKTGRGGDLRKKDKWIGWNWKSDGETNGMLTKQQTKKSDNISGWHLKSLGHLGSLMILLDIPTRFSFFYVSSWSKKQMLMMEQDITSDPML